MRSRASGSLILSATVAARDQRAAACVCGAERRRTVRGSLEVIERALEVATARPVEGEELELIVERVGERLLVGCGHEAVELASPRARQRRERRLLEQAVRERVLAVRNRPNLSDDVRTQEPRQVQLHILDTGDCAQQRRSERAAEDRSRPGRRVARLAEERRYARRAGSRARSAAVRPGRSAPRCDARRALRSRAATAAAVRGRADCPRRVRSPLPRLGREFPRSELGEQLVGSASLRGPSVSSTMRSAR